MTQFRWALLSGAAITAMLAGAARAEAEASSPSAPVASAATAEVSEVLVTARRREERALDVPVAITAFTAEVVKDRNITNQVDLANNTPSMIATGGSPRDNGGFAIRGQGPAFGATAGTVPYFADVPNGYIGIEGRHGTFFDLANIQVLKGPQGTLFGKNATGGNVLFEPQRPTNSFGGYLQVQAGNYNDRELEGALNVPLIDDKLLLRVSVASARRDGYTTDVGPLFSGKKYDDLAYDNARVSLLFRPTSTFENYTILRSYQAANNGPGTSLIDFNSAATAVFPGLPPFSVAGTFPGILPDLAAQRARGPRETSLNIDEYYSFKMQQAINSTTIDLSPTLRIKNIVSFAHTFMSYAYDYDATPFPIDGQTSRGRALGDENYFTEELQLQGRAFDNGLTYILGGFADTQWPHESSEADFDSFPVSLLLGQRVPALQRLATRSRAVFGQATLDVGKFSDALQGLSITAGYRYTVDHASSLTQILAPPANSGSAKFDYGSYTFDVDYKINPSMMVYAGARRAYKAGGLNTQVPSTSPYAAFQPEQLDDVELGFKSDVRLGTSQLRANVDVFRGSYKNIQRTTQALSPDGLLINVTRSAAQGRIQGLEFEGAWIPSHWVDFTLAYSYTDSKYTQVTDPLAGAILQGAPFPYTPKDKLSVGAVVHLPMAESLGRLSASAVYNVQAKQSIAQTNQTFYPYIPGYGTLNLRLDWREVAGRPVTVSAFVTNATDKTYAVGQFDAYLAKGYVTRTYAEPRMYGLQVRYDFGG